MVTAEVKRKSKRIAHRVRYDQVCHNFIHGDGDYFHSHDRLAIWCYGDYIFVGHRYDRQFKATNSIEYIKNNWAIYASNVLGVVNRKKKIIVINALFTAAAVELKFNTPENWNIFQISEFRIPSDILSQSKRKEFNAAVLKYQVNQFYNRAYMHCWNVIHHNARCTWFDKQALLDTDTNVKTIKSLVTKLRCKNQSCYNKPLLDIPEGKAVCPTVKQICEDTVFTEEEYQYIEKRKFWTRYCYNKKEKYSPFVVVLKNWDVKLTKEDKEKLDTKYGECKTPIKEDEYPILWRDYIVRRSKAKTKHIYKVIADCVEQSKINEQKALQENKDIVDAYYHEWLNFTENSKIDDKRITFDNLTYDNRTNKVITEKYVISVSSIIFETTKLRLSPDLNVHTSRYAKVSLEDAIKMWHFFNTVIKMTDVSNGEDYIKRFERTTIKCGSYPLVAIKYCDKIADRGLKTFDHKEWAIVIGCHTLWKDDILEFIRIYHLEDKFGIKPEVKNIKIKIKVN